ncbi:TPA: tail fiber protein [Klebsiella pneumoniae]|nr:tail fiber protein [Klebsiella pneumoniae]
MALTLLANNNAKSVLAAGISASATVITVGTGAGALFPSPVSGESYFKLTITDAATKTISEIMHVTSVSGDVMTVIRGQEGTTPRVWSTNDIVANMMTAGTFKSCLQIDNNLSEIKEAGQESVAEARSNLGIPDISAQPGDIKYTARSTAPSGWLKANGEAVSRTIYAALFEAIGTTFGIGDGSTTFNLPDLRGEFIRGWDDGRGIDSGRGFGSAQPATSLSPYVGAVNGELIVGQADVDGEGPYQNQYLKYALTTGTTQGVQFYTVRPRNIALLACIKY